jgi:periplasmic divalent cation tolerance protein
MIAMASDDALIAVLTNVPDQATALALAKLLTEERLAACVNVLAACTSIYRWKGAIERAEEIPVVIKTRAALYGQVEAAIRRLHPYELPEIIAVPLAHGLPAYLQWVAAETALQP